MRGEDERLERLFREYYPAVVAYARRRASESVADDVAAETFSVAWRRADAIPADPLPWLLGVARRVLATQRRASDRQRKLTLRLVHAPPADVARVSERRIGAALARLSESDREAILLVAWDDLRVKQAAETLGISAARFSVRLHRARRRLRDRLEETSASELGPVELLPSPQTAPGRGATR